MSYGGSTLGGAVYGGETLELLTFGRFRFGDALALLRLGAAIHAGSGGTVFLDEDDAVFLTELVDLSDDDDSILLEGDLDLIEDGEDGLTDDDNTLMFEGTEDMSDLVDDDDALLAEGGGVTSGTGTVVSVAPHGDAVPVLRKGALIHIYGT